MSPVLTDLIILVVAGLIGGYAAGFAGKEHSLGTVKNSVIGVIGGRVQLFPTAFYPARGRLKRRDCS